MNNNSDDYQRGVADERARIREYISKNAAWFAEQAGVSIEAVESATQTEDYILLKGKNKKVRQPFLYAAYTLAGILKFIDKESPIQDTDQNN